MFVEPEKAAKNPVIHTDIQRLEKANAELLEVVSALEARLSIAMREPEPQNPMPDARISETTSQLSSMLKGRAGEVGVATARLSSILRRLDL